MDQGGAAPDVAAERAATTSSHGWSMSAAVTAAVVVALLCLGMALAVSNVELALVGLPLAISAALAWDRRPSTRTLSTYTSTTERGRDRTHLDYTVAITAGPGIDAVHARLRTLGAPERDYVVAPDTAAALSGSIPVLHSGPQRFIETRYRLIGADASFLSDPTLPLFAERVVEPPYIAPRSLPLPERLTGLTGPHSSSRRGDGGEFRDIDRFTSGDRLRRIDWRATARRAQAPGELYVRRTTATSDAAILIVLDSRDDVTDGVAEWSSGAPRNSGVSSLDLAREGASSLTAGYIRAGDRVGFHDLATQTRALRPGGGARHLYRVLDAIARTTPSGYASDRVRAPQVVPGAEIIVFSTFLDDEAAHLALLWRASGHRVIGVDSLPSPVTAGLVRRELVAFRIVMMERDERLHRLRAAGIDVVRWQRSADEPDREAVLKILSRPRGVR
ncbi:DUF58 domain-containing protein [Diaminobutyricibacter sp. McL0618]|uniref:DUF58 domain-containing protein n=1 Tax=Leifsonia sp. McL0618 TaxID=3415677 RepID=UPI003CEF497E